MLRLCAKYQTRLYLLRDQSVCQMSGPTDEGVPLDEGEKNHRKKHSSLSSVAEDSKDNDVRQQNRKKH